MTHVTTLILPNTVACPANGPCYTSKCTARKLTDGPPEREACGAYHASVQREKCVPRLPSAHYITHICHHSGNTNEMITNACCESVYNFVALPCNIIYVLKFLRNRARKEYKKIQKQVQIMFNECVAFT